MPDIDAHVIQFQCPNCGHDLEQTVALLKAEKQLVCAGCKVGINFDTAKLLAAAEVLHQAVAPLPTEITIKFFR